MAKSIVQAVLNWNDFELLAKISENIGEPMKGLDVEELEVRLQDRGW